MGTGSLQLLDQQPPEGNGATGNGDWEWTPGGPGMLRGQVRTSWALPGASPPLAVPLDQGVVAQQEAPDAEREQAVP